MTALSFSLSRQLNNVQHFLVSTIVYRKKMNVEIVNQEYIVLVALHVAVYN